MSRVSIIACGPQSGSLWDGTGPSIGVNDCEKFGKPVDFLLLLNSPVKFGPERMRYIEGARPKMCYSHLEKWAKVFTNFTKIKTELWPGTEIRPGVIYHSKTSPFAALSLSYVMGFTSAVMYGCDMLTHPRFSKGKTDFEFEKIRIERLAAMLDEKHGFKTYLAAPGALNIPIL